MVRRSCQTTRKYGDRLVKSTNRDFQNRKIKKINNLRGGRKTNVFWGNENKSKFFLHNVYWWLGHFFQLNLVIFFLISEKFYKIIGTKLILNTVRVCFYLFNFCFCLWTFFRPEILLLFWLDIDVQIVFLVFFIIFMPQSVRIFQFLS